MDIQLPGMNGIEALKALRADPDDRGDPGASRSPPRSCRRTGSEIMSAGSTASSPKPINLDESPRARVQQATWTQRQA